MSSRAALVAVSIAFAIFAGACSADQQEIPALVAGETIDYGAAPEAPSGELAPELVTLMDELDSSFSLGPSTITSNFDNGRLQQLVDAGDVRVLWILADILRFPLDGAIDHGDVIRAFEELSGADISDPATNDSGSPWTNSTNRLMAWDTPPFPGYLDVKRALFTTLEPKWEPFFTPDADVDWRHVGWGGVLIDDRVLGNSDRCEQGCIPALDDPGVTDAAGGDWYDDDRLVFGVEVNGEFRAYPKNMMEIHEMVNDTLGGQRIAIPYCTLCGSAQAYLTDDSISMRTSGLLIRSNKMMFELGTMSLVDTFLGVATSGPLQGTTFEQVSVATSTWGAWKAAHPDTTIVAEDGGIGRGYFADPLQGRDDNGPIFPIGSIDDRLPVQEPVLGIETSDGRFVAVHVAIARATLLNGESIEIDDIEIELAGDGIRAVRSDGSDTGAHQAFWFAWSQFQPDTDVWPLDF